MNLHKLVRPLVSTVNPSVVATLLASAGSTTADDGTRTPAYADPVQIRVQIQALQYNDIAQTSGLATEGERRAMYISGNWEGLIRADNRGGDIISLPDGSQWLVAMVLENWGDSRGWVKVAATRQNP